MIKIWGRKNSINVQKILWCCDELELSWNRVDIGAHPGDVDTLEYRALNPHGLIPTIEDGPFVLWESNAILRYLAAKYAPESFWPPSPETRALADRWMDWHSGTLWLHMRPLFWQMVRTTPAQRDQSIVDSGYKNTLKALKTLDAHLKDNLYVAGDSFSIGDIPLGVATYRWMSFPFVRPVLPHLENWYQRLGKREAFRQHVMQPMS